jgi:hypothetical protein
MCSEYSSEKHLDSLKNSFPEIAMLRSQPFNSTYLEISRGDEDLELATDSIRNFMVRRFPVWLTYSNEERKARRSAYTDRYSPAAISPFVDRAARFIIAIAAGASLVVPMLIMLYNPSRTKSVVTVSISVILFSAVISLVMKATDTETVGATAAYAAVLVVFVGLNEQPGSG